MMNRTIADKVAIVTAILAAYFSYQLLIKHMTGASTIWFDQGCKLTSLGDKASCTAVLNSPYSYIPPKFEGRPTGTFFPAAFLGLVYYAVLTVLFMGIGRPSRERRWLLYLPIAGVALGLLGSAYFIFIMFSKIGEWCLWCAVTHGLNFIIACCLLRLWLVSRRQPKTVAIAAKEVATTSTNNLPATIATPSTRQIFQTLVSVLMAVYMCYLMFGMMRIGRLQAEIGEYKAELDRARADARTLFAGWQAAQKHEPQISSVDRIREGSASGNPLEVVIFSDFECPTCARMATFLEDRVQPLFGGRLRINFKHFPLGSECNRLVKKTVHPNACLAANIAEQMRDEHGMDGFWKVHDNLFAQQEKWRNRKVDEKTLLEFAGYGELSPKLLFLEDQSGAITNDVNLAESWGVQGTPTVFVDGKLVPPIAKMSESFWNELANYYWNTVAQQPRPESTKLSHLPPIQGSQGQQGGK